MAVTQEEMEYLTIKINRELNGNPSLKKPFITMSVEDQALFEKMEEEGIEE